MKRLILGSLLSCMVVGQMSADWRAADALVVVEGAALGGFLGYQWACFGRGMSHGFPGAKPVFPLVGLFVGGKELANCLKAVEDESKGYPDPCNDMPVVLLKLLAGGLAGFLAASAVDMGLRLAGK